MTLKEAQKNLSNQLEAIYESREANNIADWLIGHLTGLKKGERFLNKDMELAEPVILILEKQTNELLLHKPIQYVLEEAWFCGLKFFVNESVLIPRPETEELVQWIIDSNNKSFTGTILDMGTGSGCIPVSLKKKLPAANIHACDISEAALKVAQQNAKDNNVSIRFHQFDFLDNNNWPTLPSVNILVSNPPYVPLKDKASMNANVLQYEPHLALFVQDNDPLIFYNALADFAQTNLLPGGFIYAEIHEDLGPSTQDLFRSKGFTHTELKKDMQGKERMIRAAF